ncbi:hypothetical protein CLF_108601, partial [Clonorchis sinensis]
MPRPSNNQHGWHIPAHISMPRPSNNQHGWHIPAHISMPRPSNNQHGWHIPAHIFCEFPRASTPESVTCGLDRAGSVSRPEGPYVRMVYKPMWSYKWSFLACSACCP